MNSLFNQMPNDWVNKYAFVAKEVIETDTQLATLLDKLLLEIVGAGLLETKEENGETWYRATDLGISYISSPHN